MLIRSASECGRTWTLIAEIDSGGDNPPSLVQLKDGRLVMTYGRRRAPFGIGARTSGDQGRTWGDEVVLRNDGGGPDLGYTRTVQRPDGKLVTVYYLGPAIDQERFVAGTIWSTESLTQ